MNKHISKILIFLGFIGLFFINANFASALTFSANNSGNDCYSSWTTPVGCITNPGYSGYSQNNYNNNPNNQNYNNNSQYTNSSNGNTTDDNKIPIINNYYYSGSKVTPTSETTKKVLSKTNNDVKSTKNTNTKKSVYSNNINNLGLRTNNGLSALALNTSITSTNFLPHTFWQWLIVIFLILVIVILMRLINKTRSNNKSEINPVH